MAHVCLSDGCDALAMRAGRCGKHHQRALENQRAFRERNKERLNEYGRRRYARKRTDPEFRAKNVENVTRFQRQNPEKVRDRYLRWTYGIGLEDYRALLDAQGGVCAGCGVAPENQTLAVDHDHACCPGQRSCGACVRALLCSPCNLALGMLGDDVSRLRSLVAVVEKGGFGFPKRVVPSVASRSEVARRAAEARWGTTSSGGTSQGSFEW